MFEQTRRSLTRYYTFATAALLTSFTILLFSALAWFLYEEEKLEILAFANEEISEHLPLLLQGSTSFVPPPLIGESNSTEEEMQNALRMFSFIQMPGGEVYNLVTLPNEVVVWATAEIKRHDLREPRIFSYTFANGKHHRVLLAEKLIVHEGNILGKIYVGKDITFLLTILKEMLIFSLLGMLVATFFIFRFGRTAANKAMIPIEQSVIQQKRFVTNASHELRTPLSVVLTGAEVVLSDQKNNLSSDSKNTLLDIQDEIRKMSNMVSNLLTLSQMDEYSLPSKKAIDVVAIATLSVRKLLPLAEQKNITISLEDTSPITWQIDKDDFAQLLYILLDNAIKYTPSDGSVLIFFRVEKNSKKYLKIFVEDSGIGIEEQERELIFERFYRVDKARSRQTGGSGLGLSIARSLAEKYNGSVKVSSGPGKGSVFCVTLPE